MKNLLLLLLLLLLFISCEKLNRVTDIFDPPSAREVYLRELQKIDPTDSLSLLWEHYRQEALKDTLPVELAYQQQAINTLSSHYSAAYTVELALGESLNLEFLTDSAARVFTEIYQMEEDSARRLRPVYIPLTTSLSHQFIPENSGKYLIHLQGEMRNNYTFNFSLFKESTLKNPVIDAENRDIGSFFGDPRDGGKRKHKGIDIFAAKGTLVIAVTKSIVSSTQVGGLGGKTVWLYSQKLGVSLYYAHLDSQYVKRGQLVAVGDTLGTVGNTGNASTTPPHLHFAIYQGNQGAIDPLPFVKTYETVAPPKYQLKLSTPQRVQHDHAPLRTLPGTSGKLIRRLIEDEWVKVLALQENWMLIRTADGKAGWVYASNLDDSTS